MGRGAHPEVLVHREAAEHVVGLRHVGDPPRGQPVRREVGDLAPREPNAPRRDGHEARNRLDEGGLAGAVRADDRHHLAPAHFGRDPVQDWRVRPVAGDHSFRPEQGFAHGAHRLIPIARKVPDGPSRPLRAGCPGSGEVSAGRIRETRFDIARLPARALHVPGGLIPGGRRGTRRAPRGRAARPRRCRSR